MDDNGESKRCLVEGEDVLNSDHVIECSLAPEPTADSVRIVAARRNNSGAKSSGSPMKLGFKTRQGHVWTGARARYRWALALLSLLVFGASSQIPGVLTSMGAASTAAKRRAYGCDSAQIPGTSRWLRRP
ncbi:hypothetical protein HPB47_002661 [Ixodes persulcatus]|uniref:Uncharacterized protein n=1 Tax=Ixodes persulcatus TaxID=34615 RepID=A0AC60PKM6_IXOPE|nr:hypothetical protein HPB47_002661 [Ixodes persulcatus]